MRVYLHEGELRLSPQTDKEREELKELHDFILSHDDIQSVFRIGGWRKKSDEKPPTDEEK